MNLKFKISHAKKKSFLPRVQKIVFRYMDTEAHNEHVICQETSSSPTTSARWLHERGQRGSARDFRTLQGHKATHRVVQSNHR